MAISCVQLVNDVLECREVVDGYGILLDEMVHRGIQLGEGSSNALLELDYLVHALEEGNIAELFLISIQPRDLVNYRLPSL